MNLTKLMLPFGGLLCALATLPAPAAQPDPVPQPGQSLVIGILQASGNVLEARYDTLGGLIRYQTRNQKDHTLRYVWKSQDEGLAVRLTDAEYTQARQADFLLLGWGQSPTNPARYFWIPVRKLRRTFTERQLVRMELSRPIPMARFE